MSLTSVMEGLDFSQWAQARLLVAGDLILDEYLWGRVDRISPEAPVQVVAVSSETAVLGGAGNVVRNLRALGAQVSLAGVVGQDRAAGQIADLLAQEEVDRAGLVEAPGRRTSLKSRVMAGHQQVLRIDRETEEPLSRRVAGRILALAQKKLPDLDGLILSDYAKGTLTPWLIQSLISLFREAGKPVVVDPKGRSFARYKGASLLTPNQNEAREALALDCARPIQAAKKALKLMAERRWSALLVTRGSQGMSLFRPNQDPLHLPARARQVFDVSGAGDAVAAVVGLGLACGWPLERAAQLGNLAGGVVVGKVGTAAVSLPELIRAADPNDGGKILPLSELKAVVDRLKSQSRRVVFTNGCFDLLHPGQVHFLNQSKAKGDILIVALDDDVSVARLKGPGRPVIGQEERARMMAALDCVDLVTVFATEELPALLARLRPDVLTKGANYAEEEVVGQETVKKAGGRVVLIPLQGRETTSGLLGRIQGQGGKS
ncbi:MAG: D-glycero-beta-D-manno-heptose-7-phosphate kinase [Deltaproteobacteria bacterium]|nr:D-glycero-beta-D-manno-heptose-7-phosphate kinase [Deltaproteobacteria bacterium]